MNEDKSHPGPEYLPTTPGTQMIYTATKGWCAGHAWRDRRGLGWLHRTGHRLHIFRNRHPAIRYLGD